MAAALHHFGHSFDQRQAEESEAGKGEQPQGRRVATGRAATEQADGKQAGQRKDIDQRLALQPQRIGQRGAGIDRNDRDDAGNRREPDSQNKQQRAHDHAGDGRGIAGGKRAKAFFQMGAVGAEVEQIIDDIDPRGRGAKGGKGQQAANPARPIGKGVRREDWHEDQQVLHPLMRSHGAQQRWQQRRPDRDAPFHRHGDAGGHRRCHIDQHRRPGFGPHREIGAGIAGIGKASAAEALDQGGGLGRACEIMGGSGGDDLIEHAEISGHSGRHGLVGGRGQHDTPAGRTLFAQIDQQGLVIGEQRRVEWGERGDTGFQCRPPAREGGQQIRDAQAARQYQQALDQRVGAHQRAVKVDAERQRCG